MKTGTDGSFSTSSNCRFLNAVGVNRCIAISMKRVTDFLDSENDTKLQLVPASCDGELHVWLILCDVSKSSTNEHLHNGQQVE